MKKILTAGMILSLIVIAGVFHFSGEKNSAEKQSGYASISALEIFELENAKRVEEGLVPLEYNETLRAAAQNKAEYMAKKGYFSHVTPSGIPFWNWLVRYRYDYLYSGENLAVKFRTSEGVVRAWMKSENHRKNILNDGFIDTGIGVAKGFYKGVETEFVVQFFAFEMPKFEANQ